MREENANPVAETPSVTEPRHQIELPVLGHVVTFRSNSPRLLAAIDDRYGFWRTVKPNLVSQARFSVDLTLGATVTETPESHFTYALKSKNQLMIRGNGSSGYVDTDRKMARGEIAPTLLANADLFGTGLLDTLTLMLVTSSDRCPLHAAALRKENRLILLVGPSGSGKSTLTYVLQRAGFLALSDDVVFVQLFPQPRIWFHMRDLRLLPNATELFSGLRDNAPQTSVNGEQKIIVEEVVDPSPDPFEGTPFVCVLARGEKAMLTRVKRHDLRSHLREHNEPGFDRLSEPRSRVFDWLATNGGWVLTLSSNPSDAVSLIQEVVTG